VTTLPPHDPPAQPSAIAAFTARWAKSVAGTSYVPMGLAELEAHLGVLAARLYAALHAQPVHTAAAAEIGAALVDAHFTSPATIARTVALLPEMLSTTEVASTSDGPTEGLRRVAALQGAIAAGYARRLQERTLDEQDAIRTAALTAREEAENAARASEARFRAVFAGAAIGIGIGDTMGNILDANPALADMLGYTVEQMRTRNVSDFMHPEDTEAVWILYDELVRGDRDHFRTTKQFLRSDGRGIWTHLAVSLIRDDAGQPRYQIAVIEDVSDLHRLQSQLRYQANHDALTGLPNRALFQSRLGALFDGPTAGKRIGLCLLDLDGFKAINDSVGHAVGDQILITVAGRLDGSMADTEHLVARLGGDEFIILLADTTSADEVVEVAENALASLVAPIAIEEREYGVTASAGIVERPIAGTGPADLMRAADMTLYWAKAEGKNRWALFDDERSEREVAQYTLARMLPAALERGEFRLQYQPLVDLASGAPRGVEALLRWEHPRLGTLAPDSFISLAEDTGIILPLGRWVLQTACRQAHAWADRFSEPPLISVNIAVRQAWDPGLVGDVVEILSETGVEPCQLQLELTERAVIGTDKEPLAVLQQLSDAGVRIAIDDFGTGYSNMAYLRRLPVAEIKLGTSFIEGLRTTADSAQVDAEIVASLVSLAHALGLTVTAEGVETEAQAERLRIIGCDSGQGQYFGAAGPPEAIEALLAHTGSPRRDG
jgi:diguanylate cyclase (GGDEF)-like protein/PAS domain S-box-containing protein